MTDFSDVTLIKLAGKPAFERGREYFSADCVLDCRHKGNRITGTVQGSELYSVQLRLGKQGLDGHCDCPASEDVDFCKHCVALALHVREKQQLTEQLESGDPLQRIQAFLEKQDKSQLIGHLLDIIQHDDHLQDTWSIKADVALGKIDIKGLKKRITAALPTSRHLHHYPQVRAYFQKAEPAVQLLAQQFDALPAEKAVELVEYALDRLQKALETIDDSGGFRLQCTDQLQALHIEALAKVPWSKAQLAQHLFEHSGQPNRDLYPAIPDDYAAALGEEGLQAYYLLARKAWDALPAVKPEQDWDRRYEALRLGHFLQAWYEAHGDFEAALDIKLKQAVERWDFVRITEYCIQHQQWAHAKRWLAKVKTFKHQDNEWRPRLDVERLEQAILLHEGNIEKALVLQWTIFSRSMLLPDYHKLLELEQRSGGKPHYAAKVRSFLKGKLTVPADDHHTRRHANGLLEILLHEQELQAALALVRQHKVDPALLYQLTQAFSEQPISAIELYQRLVAFQVGSGKNADYKRAVKLLEECRGILKTPAHQLAFQKLLADIRTTFKAKRNFMKYLADHFSHPPIPRAAKPNKYP